MTEDQMRAIMLLAKAAWFYRPVEDILMADPMLPELPLARLYGPDSAAAANFIEKLMLREPTAA